MLIRIRACGVRPSDVRSYTGERKSSQYPRGVGHEWTGDVVALGSRGRDRGGRSGGSGLARDPWRCDYCRRGMFTYCQDLAGGQVRGGFAGYGVAPTTNLRQIPENVWYQAACFTEPLACCQNGIAKNGIRLGDDVVIVGAGQTG